MLRGMLVLLCAELMMAFPGAAEETAPPTALPAWPTPAVELHVAPGGDDGAAGTADAPLATLEAARDRLRALRTEGRLDEGGARVLVHGGRYAVTQTFTLTEQDTGTADAPVRYEAAPGETPVFSGGVRLEGFQPVTDEAVLARLPEAARGQVLQVDVKRFGVTDLAPPRLGGFSSGLGFKTHPVKELFFNGEAMPMSRWPNEGFARIAATVVDDGHTIHGRKGSKVGQLVYEGDRPARWVDEAAPLLYGYWFFGWADSYERVVSIDPQKREFVLEAPYSHYGYAAGAPWYGLNLLCEIDMPGEWYLDHTTGLLYFYPPADPASATVALSVAPFAFVEMTNVSHVALLGLNWELGAADGVHISGGSHCVVAGCTVRRCGGDGMVVDGGTAHTLLACDIHGMGRGGMRVSGGDRKALTPGGHLVENCEIYDLSRIDHTYTPAVVMSGVGNRIARNEFHHIASSAVRLGGNDHLVELNEVHHVVQESDDQGGVDMWGNATFRGNVIRYNYWHHIGNQENPDEAPDCGQAGIRLDDAISGVRVHGNVFYRASAGKLGFGAVQIHGGKDNVIDNNIIIDCRSAVSFSAWGDERWRAFIAEALDAPDIDRDLYLERYPQLRRLAEDHDVNRVSRNLVINCATFLRRNPDRGIQVDNTVVEQDPVTYRREDGSLNFRRLTAFLRRQGYDPIPVRDIGLYPSPWRDR